MTKDIAEGKNEPAAGPKKGSVDQLIAQTSTEAEVVG
jgi:hypothetical protein